MKVLMRIHSIQKSLKVECLHSINTNKIQMRIQYTVCVCLCVCINLKFIYTDYEIR